MKSFKFFNHAPVIFKLDNGLNVHLIYEDTNQIYVEYDIPVGSIHNRYTIFNKTYEIKPGTQHFLEHMMYMMPEGDAFEHFHKLGVVANAMTTYRQTTYGIIGHKNMMEATLYLIDMLETPYFLETRIEAEKSIIHEEIQMYDDEMDTLIQKKMFDQLLFNHPMITEITGHKKNVTAITKKDLERLFDHFYRSDERQLLIYGPIDINLYKKTLENYTYKIKEATKPLIKPIIEPAHIKYSEKIYPLEIETSILNMGLKKSVTYQTEADLFKYEMMMLFIGRLLYGSQSELYQKLLDDDLLIDEFNLNVICEDHTLIFMMDGLSNHTDELKITLLNAFKNGLSYLIETDFETLKKAYIGHFMMALDDIENRLYLYGKYHLSGISLEEALDALQSVSYSDLLDFFNTLDPEMLSFSHFVKKDEI